jgi:DNA-binding transcriptional LysR family regulator
MDRLDSMSLLVAVVEEGSLSGAGRRLNMPVATVSRRISDLEDRLRARLLHRTSRRLSLTDAGQTYLASARQILEQVDQAERLAAGEYAAPRGSLVVGCYVAFGRMLLLPLITEFLAAFPDVDVRLRLTDSHIDLVDTDIDVALRFGPLADSGLKAVRLGAVHQVLCASPAYLAARGTPATLADLADHDCITYLTLMRPEEWVLGDARVRVRSRLVMNNVEAAVQAAVQGAGITTGFCYLVEEPARAGRLRVFNLGQAPAALDVHLFHAGEAMVPVKLRAFIDFVAPRLRARLAAVTY